MHCLQRLNLKLLQHALFFIAACALSTLAAATSLVVQVLDKEGKLAPDAVVVVLPAGKVAAPASPLPSQVTIYQEKMRFVPAVSLVALGAKAQFVNNDAWEHHVRASAAGVAQFNAAAGEGFELRRDGKPEGKAAKTAEASFNKAGAVLLGCHIHGSMRGHVYVSESPWAALTGADGLAQLEQLPAGPAQVRVWHADQLIELAPQPYTVTAAPGLLTLGWAWCRAGAGFNRRQQKEACDGVDNTFHETYIEVSARRLYVRSFQAPSGPPHHADADAARQELA